MRLSASAFVKMSRTCQKMSNRCGILRLVTIRNNGCEGVLRLVTILNNGCEGGLYCLYSRNKDTDLCLQIVVYLARQLKNKTVCALEAQQITCRYLFI